MASREKFSNVRDKRRPIILNPPIGPGEGHGAGSEAYKVGLEKEVIVPYIAIHTWSGALLKNDAGN